MNKYKKYIIVDQFTLSKIQLRNINIFWIGIIINILGYILSRTGYVNFIVCQSLQIIGIILILITSINLIKFKIDDQYLQVIYFLYCSWLFILVLKGFRFNYDFLKSFLFNLGFGGIIYFVPLILLFPRNLLFYKKTFDCIILLGILYVAFDILALKALLNSDRSSLDSQAIVELSTDLSLPAGFILLTSAYHSNKKRLIAVGVVALTLFFAIIRARRSLILMTSEIIISSYILYLFSSKRKLLNIFIPILLTLVVSIYATSAYKPENGIFGYLIERGKEDTRTGVELYFYDDMKTKDWILGRGINGEYFCPDIEPNQVTNYRDVIETGYLQIILKGGIISLGLLLLITIPAIIKGLFYSKNILSKAAAIWIMLALLSLYPIIVTAFTLRYLLVWISIGICYSKKIRQIPEDVMRKYFQPTV